MRGFFTLFLVGILIGTLCHAASDGIRIVNWPVTTNVAGTVSVANIPSIFATMSISAAISNAPVVAVPANANRKGLFIFNNSTTTVYIAYDTIASMTHFTFAIPSQTTWTMPLPIYLSAITAIRASTGDGKLLITEVM